MELSPQQKEFIEKNGAISYSEQELENMYAFYSQGVFNGFCFKKEEWMNDTLLTNSETPHFILNQVKNFDLIRSIADLDSIGYLMYMHQEYAKMGYYFVEDLLTPITELEKKYGEGCAKPVLYAFDDSDTIAGEQFPKFLPDIYYEMVIVQQKYDDWNALPSKDRDGFFYAFGQILKLHENDTPFDLAKDRELTLPDEKLELIKKG
ncbi:hypothetical protein LV89_04761 [Arcicella aurantiaca]|uniref:Uncharacterized protein n=1 Tax=Arcicella aurantiaca TaxID=591202 RepID=A0A316DJI9_9BACT|nr:hypothetical protein [Arcicella aurantiaca]PWK16803.1 hypothetical protein LV89_04761 [Arcicella aurantiaca]